MNKIDPSNSQGMVHKVKVTFLLLVIHLSHLNKTKGQKLWRDAWCPDAPLIEECL